MMVYEGLNGTGVVDLGGGCFRGPKKGGGFRHAGKSSQTDVFVIKTVREKSPSKCSGNLAFGTIAV